jgi:hypothetical protein
MLHWFRKPIPATAPLRDYWVTVEVRLEPPLAQRGGPPAVGYFRVFGLRATPDALRDMIRGCVTDGTIIWEETEFHVVDVLKVDRRITKTLWKPFGAGPWHESGCVFFESWGGSDRDDDRLKRFVKGP